MSPNASFEPRVAFPFIRPRCCLRYLTFDGINIGYARFASAGGGRRKAEGVLPIFRTSLPAALRLRPPFTRSAAGSGGLPPRLGLVLLAAIDPGLHADLSVGRVRFGKTVVDVRLQG